MFVSAKKDKILKLFLQTLPHFNEEFKKVLGPTKMYHFFWLTAGDSVTPSTTHKHTHTHTCNPNYASHTISLQTHIHAHTHTHTHSSIHTLFSTHTHTIQYTRSNAHTLSHSLSHTHTTHTHQYTHSLSHWLLQTHTHSNTLTLQNAHSPIHSLSNTRTHTHIPPHILACCFWGLVNWGSLWERIWAGFSTLELGLLVSARQLHLQQKQFILKM